MKQKRMEKGYENKDFNAHDVDTYGNFGNEKFGLMDKSVWLKSIL
jgi:hypothetical protein